MMGPVTEGLRYWRVTAGPHGVGLLAILLCQLSAVTSSRPNIIIIVADDLGWDDVSFHGSEIATPNLDYLAHNGLILTDYYVNPVCSPTRSAILTGRYPIHTGLQTEVIYAPQPFGLPLNETLLPQYLKKLGYATHAVGKWHLGFFKKDYTPTLRGFDSHYGFLAGREDYFDHHCLEMEKYFGLDFRRNLDVVYNETGQYSTELFAAEVVSKIENHNKSQPLFVYMAYQAVHAGNPSLASLEAPQRYVNRFPFIKNPKRRIFAGMVSALDEGVGNITRALRQTGLLNNTIIVFTTDNGGPVNGYDNNAACNWPLRGGKHTVWEGGVRGTSFIYSPLLQRTGVTYGQLMHATDWVPTLYTAAGGKPDDLVPSLDGVDMWTSLNTKGPGKRQEVLINIDPIEHNSAIRVGDYKVVMGDISRGQYDGWYPPLSGKVPPIGDEGPPLGDGGPPIKYSSASSYTSDSKIKPFRIHCGKKPFNASTNCDPVSSPCLYHIPSDPCEYNNIAQTNPQKLQMVLNRLAVYRKSMVPPRNKPNDPRSDPQNHGGVWTWWE